MPYKLLIVDDEDLMREGLCNLVGWDKMGFEVAATLEDGQDAIDYIQKQPADVILTDIKMSTASGIDVAKYIADHKLNTKVVLISGYQEFELARQAMRYHVNHYLLKPPRLKDIQSVFEELKENLDHEKETRIKEEKDKERYEEALSFMVNQFFTDIVFGALRNAQDIKKRLQMLDLDFDAESSRCCLIDISIMDFDKYLANTWKYGRDNFYNAIRNYMQSANPGIQLYSINQIKDRIKILAISKSSADSAGFEQIISQYLKNAEEGIRVFFDLEVRLVIEKCFSSLINLASENSSEPAGVMEQAKLLTTHISHCNYAMAQNMMEHFFDQTCSYKLADVKQFIQDLFSKLARGLRENGIEVGIETDKKLVMEELEPLADLDELRQAVYKKLKGMIKKIEGFKESGYLNVIDRAKRYIQDNYNKDISLEDIADHIFLNPAYFSRFFKEQTGENYIDYLMNVRMEKALELLQDRRYKVHEIGNMIGYENTRYFYKIFKRVKGQTPTDYRRSLWGEEHEQED